MKIKNIAVEVKPLKDVLKDTATVLKKLKEGSDVKSKKGLSFGNVEDFREFFTPKRIELLRVIRHRNPGSLYELAKLTGRDLKAVVTDIKILEKYGLLDTMRIAVKGGYKVKPIFDYDRLCVDIAM
jgi:predicted transcriptional regulator